MAKAKQESKRTWDLIGWKQIPQLAMEQGWFNELGKSPVECVFYTDFEDIAARISEFRVLNR